MKRLLIALFVGLYISMSFLACAPMMPKEGKKIPKGYDPANVDPVEPVGDGNAPAEKPVEKPVEEPATDEGPE